MFRFQYSIVTRAQRGPAWEIFSDFTKWHHFADVYGKIQWREGRPWHPSARMELEIVQPFHAVIDHVITSCAPARRVGWIDTAMGAVLAQWVMFEDDASGGTRVHTWGDLLHSAGKIADRTPEELVTCFTRVWYENFGAYCDMIANGAEIANFTPLAFPGSL
jgi:hypothetical protein